MQADCYWPDVSDDADFVDVLLSLDGEEKLNQDDMIAVLWEMIYTTALLREWIMAELVQTKMREELASVVGSRSVTDADMVRLPYLQLTSGGEGDVEAAAAPTGASTVVGSPLDFRRHLVAPAQTRAMVNMWAIIHDQAVWAEPLEFKPERFVLALGGEDVDMRLAPFGAGQRVCPGKNLGMSTVELWVAKLVQQFQWAEDKANPVDLTHELQLLKLSCEMKYPLVAVAKPNIIAN